jgi:hypothetical protein
MENILNGESNLDHDISVILMKRFNELFKEHVHGGLVEVRFKASLKNVLLEASESFLLKMRAYSMRNYNIELGTKTRRGDFAIFNMCISYILIKRYELTYEKIGEILNNDHSTIHHRVKKMSGYLDIDDTVSKNVLLDILQYAKIPYKINGGIIRFSNERRNSPRSTYVYTFPTKGNPAKLVKLPNAVSSASGKQMDD